MMERKPEKKFDDEIVEEVRRIKEDLAAAYDHDIDRMVAEARRKQATSGHEVVSFMKKPDAA